jgi:hypothetical protein
MPQFETDIVARFAKMTDALGCRSATQTRGHCLAH